MRSAGRSPAVRRWIRRPLWWGAAALALAGALFAADVAAARRDDRRFDRGLRVQGTVDAGWDGGRDVEVTYRHPESGEQVSARTFVWDTSRLPATAGPVDLEVSRRDPTDVALAGDRLPVTANLGDYAPWALLPSVVWALRLWSVRRAEGVMAADGVAYAMLADGSASGWWLRRCRLNLHPLDADPDGPPVCTVPLVEPPVRAGTFAVEVKGSPRPFGRVVARDSLDGTVLWPAGRALRSPGRPAATAPGPAAAPSRSPALARWLLVAGAIAFVAGFVGAGVTTFADDVRDRSEVVTATATGGTRAREDGRVEVDVTYEYRGRTYAGSVTEGQAPGEGARVSVRIDPQSPSRVWSTGQETPPGTSDGALPGLALMSGVGLLVAGGLLRYQDGARRLPPAPGPARGLELLDGRLWYGRWSALTNRPRARFDPDALVLVDAAGVETAYRWDDHAASPTARPQVAWRLVGVPPSRNNRGGMTLYAGEEHRSLSGGWTDALWAELPALAAYLGATPAARAGLGRPALARALVDELAAHGWRRPPPPGEPLLGDPLDLHLAVVAVLDRHLRRFGDRPVRGEPVPAVEQLVPEVLDRLPAWVRPRVTPEAVAERVARHLATGPWPFDVLLADPAAE